MNQSHTALLASALFVNGCGARPLPLGSDILWQADAESGDLTSWTSDALGGSYTISSDTRVAVSTARSHTGRYAIEIANDAAGTEGGGGLYREDVFPNEAYYSAWYYVPKQYQTITGWLVMRFAARQDATTVYTTIGLTLYSRPGGNFELRVNDYRPEYLQAPLADPPPVVPVGQWFHIETFYRNVDDSTGRVIVWLDGIRRYDIARPLGSVPKLYFAVCGQTTALEPPDAQIFIDDVAISHTRVTPSGVLEVPP